MDVKIDKRVIVAALACLGLIMLRDSGFDPALMIMSFVYFLGKK